MKDDFYNKILKKNRDNDTIISNKNNNLFLKKYNHIERR